MMFHYDTVVFLKQFNDSIHIDVCTYHAADCIIVLIALLSGLNKSPIEAVELSFGNFDLISEASGIVLLLIIDNFVISFFAGDNLFFEQSHLNDSGRYLKGKKLIIHLSIILDCINCFFLLSPYKLTCNNFHQTSRKVTYMWSPHRLLTSHHLARLSNNNLWKKNLCQQ